MNRIDQITDILRPHFLGIGAAVSVASLDEYDALDPSPTKRLGIYGPMPYPAPGVTATDDDPPLMIVFCPEYIDRLTGDLDDEVLQTYVGIVAYVGDMMIALGDEPDPTVRFRQVEDTFVKEWPDHLSLMNHVEMRALDLAS